MRYHLGPYRFANPPCLPDQQTPSRHAERLNAEQVKELVQIPQ
jgi:hypothetical protein